MSTLDEEAEYAAALAEEIYRHSAADQALEVDGIGLLHDDTKWP